MSMNSGGGGRAGRINRLVEDAKRKKLHQKAYDQHEYDGGDPDMEAESA